MAKRVRAASRGSSDSEWDKASDKSSDKSSDSSSGDGPQPAWARHSWVVYIYKECGGDAQGFGTTLAFDMESEDCMEYLTSYTYDGIDPTVFFLAARSVAGMNCTSTAFA